MADESTAIPRLLKPAEAADALRCTREHLTDLVHAGLIRYIIIGTGTKRIRRMFREADIVEFLNRQTRREQPPDIHTQLNIRSQLKARQAEIIKKNEAAAAARAVRCAARRQGDLTGKT
jgi:hypothetical protein